VFLKNEMIIIRLEVVGTMPDLSNFRLYLEGMFFDGIFIGL
jgi:hypothetical protein